MPSEEVLEGMVGDNLYTLLLVAGIIDVDDPQAEYVCIEKGALSPSLDSLAESMVFSAAEQAEGWILASQHTLTGDAVLTLGKRPVLHRSSQHPLAEGWGLVMDVGTATISAGLVNLDSMLIPSLTACRSSQMKIAQDIGTRYQLARQDEALGPRLAQLLREDIAMLVEKLCMRSGVAAEQISAMVLVGRPGLKGLLCDNGLSDDESYQCVKAADLGLKMLSADMQVFFLPAAKGGLGADAVAAALAADMWSKKDSEKISILVDTDVDSVVMAAGKGRLIACTVPTAALEGVGISSGMQATTGAIVGLNIDSELTVRTIHDARPRGLCGAGLLSVVHTLRSQGIIDNDGKLVQPSWLPENIIRRFRGTAAGREFVISYADHNYPHDICLNQEDMVQMQLSKGALRAAVYAILAEMDACDADVGALMLAESYRSNIRPESVQMLHLSTTQDESTLSCIGNAAWQGGYLVLSDQSFLRNAQELADVIQPLDLSANFIYAEEFIRAMEISS